MVCELHEFEVCNQTSFEDVIVELTCGFSPLRNLVDINFFFFLNKISYFLPKLLSWKHICNVLIIMLVFFWYNKYRGVGVF